MLLLSRVTSVTSLNFSYFAGSLTTHISEATDITIYKSYIHFPLLKKCLNS
jgi:hypothetical protein